MGILYHTVAGRVTNPGAVVSALTPNTGDSFTVQNFNAAAGAYLESMWAAEGTPGVFRIRSPKMHDFVQGIRSSVAIASARQLLALPASQVVYPQDTLTVELSGGGAETDVGVYQIYYADNPGADQRLAMWEQIKPRIVNILVNEVDIAGAATLGDWSAGTAINATFDLLKANTDYAVLGYTCQSAVAAVAIAGPDTSNFKVGGPGATEPIEVRDWFVKQSNQHQTPHIPIFNSANKGSTLAYQTSNVAGVTNNVGFILAQLKPSA